MPLRCKVTDEIGCMEVPQRHVIRQWDNIVNYQMQARLLRRGRSPTRSMRERRNGEA